MVRLKEGESRTYTVPLRREFLKVPKWRRSKRAAEALRAFLTKHTKSEKVVFSRWVNEKIWMHGAKNPPGQLKIDVKREKDRVFAELVDLPPRAKRIIEAEKKAAKEKEKKKLPEKNEEKRKEEKKDTSKKSKTKTQKTAKKASRKDLQKELEAAKKAEEKGKIKKAKPAPTRQQEIKMRKK